MNGLLNEVPDLVIENYPTLIFVPRGPRGQNIIMYKGVDYDRKSIMKWLQ